MSSRSSDVVSILCAIMMLHGTMQVFGEPSATKKSKDTKQEAHEQSLEAALQQLVGKRVTVIRHNGSVLAHGLLKGHEGTNTGQITRLRL